MTGNRNLLLQAVESKATELAADMTLVVSAAEQKMLGRDCPEARVRIVSNIHEVYPSTRPFQDRGGIVFIGAFSHHPNVDAMEFFCKDILPDVREQLGDVKITIAGGQPPQWLQDMRNEQFVVAGWVLDIGTLLSECRVLMAPVRYGAGVKGKVLLSMGYGVPVVGMSIAGEGIPARTRREIMIADDAVSFADALGEAYRDELLWNTLVLARRGESCAHRFVSRLGVELDACIGALM